MLSREENYRMAYLSYTMKDYDTSFRYMEDLLNSVRGELSPSERLLLLSSGDWLIDLHMTKINKLSTMLSLEPNDAAVADYRARLIFEVQMICRRYLGILHSIIIVTTDLLSLVLYYWARGDCYRVIVETMKDRSTDEFQNCTHLTIEAYTKAWDEARILVKSDPKETKHLVVLAHRFVLFLCDVVEQYTEAREIALQTLSDIKPKNIFSLVMNIQTYMECAKSRDRLKMLVGLCNYKLNHVPVNGVTGNGI